MINYNSLVLTDGCFIKLLSDNKLLCDRHSVKLCIGESWILFSVQIHWCWDIICIWLIDWFDKLIDWLIDQPINYLFDWLMDWLIDWLIDLRTTRDCRKWFLLSKKYPQWSSRSLGYGQYSVNGYNSLNVNMCPSINSLLV